MLLSNTAANFANASTFKVSLTSLELEFMVIQMEASIDACKKAGITDVKSNPHFQGLERILQKLRDAQPQW